MIRVKLGRTKCSINERNSGANVDNHRTLVRQRPQNPEHNYTNFLTGIFSLAYSSQRHA